VSDYTIKNIKDVEDAAAGRATGVEARMGRSSIGSKDLGVSYFRYDAGKKASYGHRHKVQEEAYVVVSGGGRMKLDDDIVEIKQWDVVRVAPEVIRGFEAGPDGLELVIVGGPRPEDGDGEMISDWWVD